jgi:hypothetical protein
MVKVLMRAIRVAITWDVTKQQSKEVIARLKALCEVKEEKKFETRLKELKKIVNDDAKAWLLEQLSEKSKWVLAFDDGGS